MLGGQAGGLSMPSVRIEIIKGVAPIEQTWAAIRRMTDVRVEEPGRNPDHIVAVNDWVDAGNRGRKERSHGDPWGEREGRSIEGQEARAPELGLRRCPRADPPFPRCRMGLWSPPMTPRAPLLLLSRL